MRSRGMPPVSTADGSALPFAFGGGRRRAPAMRPMRRPVSEADVEVAGRVRGATLQDMDRVAALWTLITLHHAPLDPLFRMRRGAEAEGELRELLRALHRDPDAQILVFEEAGSLDGLCIVRIDHAPPILEEVERAEITDLGVRPEVRRRGLARRLVREAESWVRDRGVARIEIQVASGNREGQAFWRAVGYGDLMDVLHKRL